MKKIKIVIADDFTPVREIWKKILNTDERIEVIDECNNGEELLKMLQNMHPDVILMDINMSPLNGFETSILVKEKYPEIKILGISVHNDPSYAQRMLELGANGFIPKTAKKEDMLKAILTVNEGGNYLAPAMNAV